MSILLSDYFKSMTVPTRYEAEREAFRDPGAVQREKIWAGKTKDPTAPDKTGPYDEMGERKEVGALSRPVTAQPGGQPALSLPPGADTDWIQRTMPIVSIGGTLSRIGKQATSTGYQGERPGMSFVQGYGYVPTYGNYQGQITGAGEMYGVESYLPPEDSALSQGLGYLGDAASYAGAGYGAYKIAKGEGTPAGTTQLAATGASKLMPALSPYASYLAYYQMVSMGAEGEKAFKEKNPEYSPYLIGTYTGEPTSPAAHGAMSIPTHLVGKTLGGKYEDRAEQYWEEGGHPEEWFLGKKESPDLETAVRAESALDPVVQVTNIGLGKESPYAESMQNTINPGGEFATEVVQGDVGGAFEEVGKSALTAGLYSGLEPLAKDEDFVKAVASGGQSALQGTPYETPAALINPIGNVVADIQSGDAEEVATAVLTGGASGKGWLCVATIVYAGMTKHELACTFKIQAHALKTVPQYFTWYAINGLKLLRKIKKAEPDLKKFYTELKPKFIPPCVELAEQDKLDEAVAHYWATALDLFIKYMPEVKLPYSAKKEEECCVNI